MTDIRAVRAAAVQHAEYRGFTDPEPEDFAIAEDMLAAAAPFIVSAIAEDMLAATAERERIRQLAIEHGAQYDIDGGYGMPFDGLIGDPDAS